MKPLYSQTDFDSCKPSEKLPCECYHCCNTFYAMKKNINHEINHPRGRIKFCSRKCLALTKEIKRNIICSNCMVEMVKRPSEINSSKSGNYFCCQSCAATFNNKNKTTGNRRSKLEIWLEEQLILTYPNLPIDFNKKSAIGSELDIYIPSLNIAFELNGIFHYEPIYGTNKLNQIQSNDISKSKACYDNKIDLCIIDTSTQSYFKPLTSQKYLDIIIKIINERILTS